MTTVNKRLLVAFDFDHTIIDGNSDTIVRQLLSTKPPECQPSECWTSYMQNIFQLLHEEGVSYPLYLETMTTIPATPNMTDLLKFLDRNDVEVIIISDSNSVFIEMWLTTLQQSGSFQSVYTNQAYFDSSELLKISMHHNQTCCDLCPINLCKGHVLEKHLKARLDVGVTFSHVAFVGDGRNDFCPCTRLSTEDYAFARKGFTLERLLGTCSKTDEKRKIVANKHVWNTALDIQTVLSEVIP